MVEKEIITRKCVWIVRKRIAAREEKRLVVRKTYISYVRLS